jgi:protein-S-isoprenylcysteine O-methyltransferase Ste14
MSDSSWRRGASASWYAWIAVLVIQLGLSPFLFSQATLPAVQFLGWATWFIMCMLGWWPVVELRRRGSVAKGASYTETTRLVDTGPYAIVRHPQYLSFMLINLSLALIVQHWLVAILGAVGIALVYFGILPDAERFNLSRFGDEYRRYAEKVPRVNLVSGVARLLRPSGR